MPSKEEFVHYQQRRQDMYSESRRNLSDANQTERDLCGQLILAATVLLGLSGAFLASEWSKDIEVYQSLLIVTGILSLISSLAFGVGYYFSIIKSEITWAHADKDTADTFDRLSTEADQLKIQELLAQINSIQEKKIRESDNAALKLEIAFLGLAGLAYMLLAVTTIPFDKL